MKGTQTYQVCIHPFIYLEQNILLSIYYVPGIEDTSGELIVQGFCLTELLMEETDHNEQRRKKLFFGEQGVEGTACTSLL